MKKINILGYGGHACVVGDACLAQGLTPAAFFVEKGLMAASPSPAGKMVLVSREEKIPLGRGNSGTFALGIGDNQARWWWCQKLLGEGLQLPPIVHPRAWISPSANLAEGVFVGAGAVVQAGVRVGQAVIINTNATVEHHCEIGLGSHVGPGSVLAGLAKVGKGVMIGAGAVLKDRVQVGDGGIVGAGAVVVNHVSPGITVAGVPAKPLP